ATHVGWTHGYGTTAIEAARQKWNGESFRTPDPTQPASASRSKQRLQSWPKRDASAKSGPVNESLSGLIPHCSEAPMGLRDWLVPPATLATLATDQAQKQPSVATVATVATPVLRHRAAMANAVPHYRWLVLWPDGRRREVCCLPEMNEAELLPCYP